MNLSSRLNEVLDMKGISNYRIAKDLGISASTVANYRNGKTSPDTEILKNIAQYLGLSIDSLLSNSIEELTNRVPVPQSGTGVPYYNIDVTASLVESFNDIKEDPEFYVDFRPFNDCTAYLPVYGDSMYPMIASGEIVALKKVDNPAYIQYGEPHLVITDAEANNMRTIKIIRKSTDKSMVILKPSNPNFDELEIPRKTILGLYIVKGKITRKQL